VETWSLVKNAKALPLYLDIFFMKPSNVDLCISFSFLEVFFTVFSGEDLKIIFLQNIFLHIYIYAVTTPALPSKEN
jgi:hypothetical protein